jgi:hypothetical protein
MIIDYPLAPGDTKQPDVHWSLAKIHIPQNLIANFTTDPTHGNILSSMMGKSRLMKEMATSIPFVYICARSDTSTGYPPRTAAIVDYFQCKHSVPSSPGTVRLDDTGILPTSKYTSFILGTFECLSQLLKDQAIHEEYGIKAQAMAGSYSWMWCYFAEPSNQSALHKFWCQGIEKAVGRNKRTVREAIAYYSSKFRQDVTSIYNTLIQSFRDVGYESSTPVFVLDFAKCLRQMGNCLQTITVSFQYLELSEELFISSTEATNPGLTYSPYLLILHQNNELSTYLEQ